jgi:hypothetical protein
MKKLAIAALLTAAMTIAAPVSVVAARSAVVDEVLASAIAQNPSAAKVQELLEIKQEIDQGDHQALLGRVNQAVMDQMGHGDIAPVTAAVMNASDLRTVAETAVRQKVETRMSELIAPYQPQITLVGGLLANTGLVPASLKDGLAASGLAPNYRQLLETALTTYLRS